MKCNPLRDLHERFDAHLGPSRAALLCALILAMLGSCKAAVEPTTVAIPSPTAFAGGPSATLSPAPQAAATELPTPAVPAIFGTVFHDWNGNGKQDSAEAPGEPALPGIRVCLDDIASDLCAVSDEGGQYLIEGVLPGDHTLVIDSQHYLYLFPSVDAALALEPQQAPVTVDGRTLVNLGLGEGPLTLPFLCAEMGQVVGISDHFDRDRRPGPARDWMGRPLSKDGYGATTFEVQGEVQIVAPAPALVNYVGPDSGHYVVELRSDAVVPWLPDSRPLFLYLYGLDEASVTRGDTVARGQVLGRITESGSEGGRERLSIRAKYTDGYGSYIFIDLFRDTQREGAHGLWTLDNNPICFQGS